MSVFSMINVNNVTITGRLTEDPKIRYTPQNGKPVTTLRIASNRTYKTATGDKKEETIYVDIVCWGRQAETCCDFLSKGSAIYVEGRLNSREYKTKEDFNRTVYEVIANRVQFLERSDKLAAKKELDNE